MAQSIWLVVGLGNPGTKYALNRHNIGFMTLDNMASGCGNPPAKNEFNSTITKFKLDDQDVILAKPLTYMNLSGEAVQGLMSYFKIDQDHLLVVHDDIDQGFGAIRFHRNRGHGGHNGIRSISEVLGTADYARLKLGVGRPTVPQMQVADYVLQNFSADEMKVMPEFLNVATDAIESFIFDGLQLATSRFNIKNFQDRAK